jgi:myo-inositol-1(or 4)-monophosphatase
VEREHTILCNAVVDAGQRALALASKGFEVHSKSDRSPVTTADLEVNRILERTLLSAFPEDGWLSEETPDSPARLSKSRVWVIDPIDGTKAFIRRRPHFVVSAALVQDGRPVLGAVYNPSTGELFTAASGQGTRLNGHLVQANAPAMPRLGLLVNPYEFERGRFRAIAEFADCRTLGSIAYSLALVAAGTAPAMITFERENEWDVAAGAILMLEAGGTITDGDGKTLQFNQSQPVYRGTIAVSSQARSVVTSLVQRLRSAA